MTTTWQESAKGLVQRCLDKGYIRTPSVPPLTDVEVKKILNKVRVDRCMENKKKNDQ